MKFSSPLALATAAGLLCVLFLSHSAEAQCQTFYEGLCPGPANCMCTLGESCGSEKNLTKARGADGGCTGQCRLVDDGDCPGDSSCLLDAGPCDAPPPPPPSNCQTFYEGLCPGPANCMCTLGESCGSGGDISKARSADGGCSGQCRLVDDGDCPGDSSCLLDAGPCAAPPPPPPPPSSCQTFYAGLCPGPASCMCTLGESCGSGGDISKARSADGGCSGQCRQVDDGDCPGDDTCLLDAGPCDIPPPPPPGSYSLGGDVSSFADSGAWSCSVQGGWSFMIVRSYCSYGGTDPNALPTIQAAKAGGITTTDVYHFPCESVDATQQVQDDVNGVGSGNFGTLWFDIETNPSPNCGWSGDLQSNCNFLGDMISAGQSLGIHLGVYCSAYMWSSIMGDGCTVGADNGLPLWYAHYDDTRSFDDYTPFGGWNTPTMKQYNDNSEIGSNCGISADADFTA